MMHVLKFGGTSVANAQNILKTVDIVLSHTAPKKIVVVSALSGVTDLLIQAGSLAADGNEQYIQVIQTIKDKHVQTVQQLLPATNQSSTLSEVIVHLNQIESLCEGIFKLGELSLKIKDKLISYGELLSSFIISSYLTSKQINHQWLDSRDVIITNDDYGFGKVDFETTNQLIKSAIQDSYHHLFIAPGFIASNHQHHTTTLGRGGSDYTAAIFAAAIQANELEIWTDVSGMMTADPRIVPNAKHIHHITYKEAMELSHFGAKVIYPPTIQPAMRLNIPIWIKNTFAPTDYGTLIEQSLQGKHQEMITGISGIQQVSLLSLEGAGMVGIPGFSKRLFEILAQAKINVILITQSSSEHSICVGIQAADSKQAELLINAAFEYEIETGKLDPVQVETDLSIVAVIGDNMKNHTGISGRMFSALGRNGVNIRAIAQGSSEMNISAVIQSKDLKKAINILHEEFFESSKKTINVFIVGTGNVGSKLIEQIDAQQAWLKENLHINIQVSGLTNSKLQLIHEDGIGTQNWKQTLQEKGTTADVNDFIQQIIEKNMRNSVLVDVSANAQVAASYSKLLEKSIAVVACNKIAASSPYADYHNIKMLAKEFNTKLLFETNVGAGLPIIGTLNDLIKSGDKILGIQAVLSGTLNFVFNNYDGKTAFADVVKQAQHEGYTEPDPRLDLGGTDVMRKILILAREAGYKMEMEDIENNGFLPDSCYQGDVANFYIELQKHESHFYQLLQKAKEKNGKLKFVASLHQGKAKVGLEIVQEQSDFYHLYGKDNLVLFYTNRYPTQPLVIKGAGAGADVTASGVFADILRVV